jgi:hypothetical protein
MTSGGCTRDGCQIGETSKCLEGFEPVADCPYRRQDGTGEGDATGKPAFLTLPSGEALSEEQASEVTREAPTKVVVLAGPHASGKTTILTSLFDSFLEAPVGNYLFAGSRTLVGFERRCHDSREASGRDNAHTVHTQVSDAVDFLHLRLADSATTNRRTDLLLSDVSGERFKLIRDSADAVKKMRMLQRADHLCIVVDGEKIAESNLRHSVRADARTLLRSVVEANVLSPSCAIQVVFSKWDVVKAHRAFQSISAFVGDTQRALEAVAGGRLLQYFEIAARPKTKKMRFAFGLPTLLRSWIDDGERQTKDLYLPDAQKVTREFARFATSASSVEFFRGPHQLRHV